MSGITEEHPLIAFKPPACSAVEYLCIVQDQLDVTNKMNKMDVNLAALKQAMADSELLDEIGWDLVTVLPPLLPESEHLLQQLFNEGNAKELLLQSCIVIQRLFRLNSQQVSDDDKDEDHKDEFNASENEDGTSSVDKQEPPATETTQLAALLHQLPKLLTRLLVKATSRFAAPLFQAVLAAFERASRTVSPKELLHIFDAACDFINNIPTDGKPHLPPRGVFEQSLSSKVLEGQVSGIRHGDSFLSKQTFVMPTGDSTDEVQVHIRLVQAFAVTLYSTFVRARASEPVSFGDASLGWAGRILEHHQPKSLLPGLKLARPIIPQQLTKRFILDKALADQDRDINSSLSLLWQRGVTVDTLLEYSGRLDTKGHWGFASDSPPSSTDKILFAASDAVLIIAAHLTYSHRSLFENADESKFAESLSHLKRDKLEAATPTDMNISIFPHHADMVKACTSNDDVLPPDGVVEALLAIGLDCFYRGNIGQPATDDIFPDYFMRLAQIAACSDSPSTRYVAHKLVSSIMLVHNNYEQKLTIMHSTLLDCPFRNLRESAVGWFKEETLAALPDSPFGDGTAMKSIASTIFPRLHVLWANEDTKGEMDDILQNQGLFLATLNLYRLLIRNDRLSKQLNIKSMHIGGDGYGEGAKAWFLEPLLDTLSAAITSLASLENTMALKIETQTNHDNGVDFLPGLENVRGKMLDLDLVKSLATDIEVATREW